MSMSDIGVLGISDSQDFAAFFIRHMTMPQRGLLMAEHPILYMRVFPRANKDTIINRVRFALNQLED